MGQSVGNHPKDPDSPDFTDLGHLKAVRFGMSCQATDSYPSFPKRDGDLQDTSLCRFLHVNARHAIQSVAGSQLAVDNMCVSVCVCVIFIQKKKILYIIHVCVCACACVCVSVCVCVLYVCVCVHGVLRLVCA